MMDFGPSRCGCAAIMVIGFLAAGKAWSADDTPSALKAVAVTIQRVPPQSWAGYGIFLGDGLILTAAHVAGRGILTHPSVVVSGRALPTETVKEGSYPDNDLAVLRVTPPWPSELDSIHVTICTDPPHPGQPVIVITPDQVSTSVVIAPDVLPPDLRARYSASIKDVYTTGNSGSGVFDAGSRCLLGIMSSKIEQHLAEVVDGRATTRTIGLAKHFVPAADIRAFLDGVTRP